MVSRNTEPFVVVLTGGIASGKTAVSNAFARLGIDVIDTDVIARALVERGQPALDQITEEFGAGVLDRSGALERKQMRKLIFRDPESKRKLEAILHPAIRAEAARQLAEASSAYAILVVPLLAESGSAYLGDRVLVVDVDEESQIQRVMNRDDIDRKQAESIIGAQASREARLALADDVLLNDSDLQTLTRKVNRLHATYLKFAN